MSKCKFDDILVTHTITRGGSTYTFLNLRAGLRKPKAIEFPDRESAISYAERLSKGQVPIKVKVTSFNGSQYVLGSELLPAWRQLTIFDL